MNAHKFKYGANSASGTQQLIFCEYCGLIAFHGDRLNYSIEAQKEAKEDCPRAPEPVENSENGE